MIIAPPATVSAWRNESARLLALTRVQGLAPDVFEALHHASALLLASAFNAIGGGPPEALAEGVKMLVDAVVAEQATGGTPGAVCPADPAFACGCGPAGQVECGDGLGEMHLAVVPAAGDDGCEGGCSA